MTTASVERGAPSADEISAFLARTIAELAGVPREQVSVRETFAALGLSSASAVTMVERVGGWLGRTLPPDLAWQYPTIREMAEGLAAQRDTPVDQRTRAASGAAQEPVAVIGIGCVVADLRGPRQLWQALCDGTELVGAAPRWRGGPGGFGSFLPDPYAFDANHFGISAAEAAQMDPQQRILLETVADAFDDAGLPTERLAGSATGTFVGIGAGDYGRELAGADGADINAVTGNASSIAANRLAYLYDLRGPSLSVDTACSSSLVAVHLALRSLHDGDCELAVAAGVNLTLDPRVTDSLAAAGMLAPDGRCKTFDRRADGYVRGEGCLAVVLKPLAAAERDGDRVYAVLLGSAVNQDGRTNGLTAPNYRAQVDVLRRAYERAGVAPGAVQYIEAHGTGTALGDAIEARALGAVLTDGRTEADRALVGSVKTIFGHLEAAAGIAGLVKTVLALHHGQVPGNRNFESPSAHIAFADLPFEVPTAPTPWPGDGPALAGVSSFGFGGTNAHVVATGVARREPKRPSVASGGPHLFALSGRSETAALAVAESWREMLDDTTDLAELSDTSLAHRTHHPFRIAVVANEPAELADKLAALTAGALPPGCAAGRVPRSGAGPVGFIFTGQGNQWIGMGRTLIRRQAVFRDALLEVDKELRPLLGWSPFTILDRGRDADELTDTGVAQPVLFALQVALAALWRSLGIEPAAVAGHSMGEVAAAYVAGALDLPAAAAIIAARAKATASARGNGRMAVVNCPLAELDPLPEGVHLAGVNAARWTVLSGTDTAIAALLAGLEQRQILARPLPGPYAFHSPLMRDCAADFAAAMPAFTATASAVPFYSTATGALLDGAALDGGYWADQVTMPVAFAAAIGSMIEAGVTDFIEIGPHPVLSGMLKNLLRQHDRAGIAVPSLTRDVDDQAVLHAALGELHVRGHELRWSALHRRAPRRVPLPLYPYERSSFRIVQGRTEIGPAPERAARTGLFADDADLVAPRNEYEQVVAEMWAEMLGLDRVGVFENFFRLGGHSLLATQFVRTVRERFEIDMPLRRMLTEPTVAQVAATLEQLMVEQAQALLETTDELTG
ncbi:type I polyketide synthase [Nocardia arthritidis]|uniref:Acyltransferase domain-containing protein n=1 Tax=Nocardia arthritidis TaxID=228602 RepID=A0A6G9YIC0_9NOCA|nr:type I polyketide synthase [Nocardia arthritidis]QIS12941.1 acyltransferase domain-containing protein [Nocardia arthritidis]